MKFNGIIYHSDVMTFNSQFLKVQICNVWFLMTLSLLVHSDTLLTKLLVCPRTLYASFRAAKFESLAVIFYVYTYWFFFKKYREHYKTMHKIGSIKYKQWKYFHIYSMVFHINLYYIWITGQIWFGVRFGFGVRL